MTRKQRQAPSTMPSSMHGLERQAAEGDGNAACSLGDHYRTGDVVAQDWVTAFRWYSRGARLGDRDAQNNLGTLFLRGLGCRLNKTKAVEWYRRSAHQGNVDAQWNLAKRYLHGDGVRRNYAAAYKWFANAARQGQTLAACEMGTMHLLGYGVQRNLLAAADFHLIAAEAGDELACRHLSEYRNELADMALSGSQMASLFLCRMHNRGSGAEKSQPLTWAWIRCAAKHCRSDRDPDIAQEVSAAHDFYRKCITPEFRRQGERALRGLRAVGVKPMPSRDSARSK